MADETTSLPKDEIDQIIDADETKPARKGRVSKKDVSVRFNNRRRMAWIALFAILVVTTLLLFFIPVEKINALGSVITWFYMAMTTIVGTYMGATTYAYVASMKS
jgi:polyferredoxin